jgi:hypothetical protein
MKFKDAIDKVRPKIDHNFRVGMRITFLVILGVVGLTIGASLLAERWGGLAVAAAILAVMGFVGFGTRSDRGAK